MKPIHLGTVESGEVLALNSKDRQMHMHVIGASGTGKSKFLELLIRHDLHNLDTGACIIDPHGKLVDDIMNYVSHAQPSLAKRIVLFEPASQLENIIGFNPIAMDSGPPEIRAQTLIEQILRAWGQADQDLPRIRRWLYNVIYTLVINDLTLVEASPLVSLHDTANRNALIENVHNREVRGDWEAYNRSGNRDRQTIMEGVGNRISRMLQSEPLRLIFSQQTATLNISEIIQKKKILLVSLRGSELVKSDDLKILGIMMLSEIFRVGMLRDERDPRLVPFHLYIDEFGQYVTESVSQMLDEIRKKKVFLTLAHQHLSQLINDKVDETILNSVTTNCRMKVAFGGLNTKDAKAITELMWTGKINLHESHSYQPNTKHRPIEETRTVITNSENDSSSWSHTEGESESDADSRGHSHGSQWNKGQNTTESEGGGLSKSSVKTTASADQHGTNQSTTNASGTGKNEGHGTSENEGENTGHSSSQNSTAGHSIQHRVNSDGTITPIDTYNDVSGSSSNINHSTSKSRSSSKTWGASSFESRSTQEGNSKSHTDSEAVAKGMTENKSFSQATGESNSEGGSNQNNFSKTHTKSNNSSDTKGGSHGTGHSEATVPFHRMEEYDEGRDKYYTIPEQIFRKQGELMNLDIGQAVIKIKNADPGFLQVKHVKSVRWTASTSPIRVAQAKQRILQYNGTYYTPRQEAEKEAEQRQLEFFETPLQFKEIEIEYSVQEDKEEISKDQGGVFNV